MKKSILLVCALMGISLAQLKAQVIFSDDFSDQNLSNWTIVNNNQSSQVQWKWDNSSQTANGAPFNYSGAANGAILLDSDGDGDTTNAENTTITSRKIVCTGKPLIELSFQEFFQKYISDTPRVYISTDSVNWTAIYNPALGLAVNGATANPHFVLLNISAQAANKDSVYLRFSWKGRYDYWWFVDDVSVFVPELNNVEMNSETNTFINGCSLSSNEQITIRFTNRGQNPISSVVAKYVINTPQPVTDTITINPALAEDSSYTYTFTQTADLSAQGTYSVLSWLELAGDTIHTNDTAAGGLALSVAHINPTTPYTMGFEVPNVGNEIAGLAWITDDENADDNTWFLSQSVPHGGGINFRYLYNQDGTTGANDWLYSTCIDMDSTKYYNINFWDKTGYDDNGIYPEKLEVKAGKSNNVAGMTEAVRNFGTIIDTVYTYRSLAFKPASNGTYYIGFHCTSLPNQWYLNVDDFGISILNKPTASFVPVTNGDTVRVGDLSGEAITTWTWQWGDGSSSTGQNPVPHVYSQPGTYSVCLIVQNVLGGDTVCQNVTIAPSGITEADISNNIAVFPNPTKSNLSVFLNDAVKGTGKIEIVNSVGESLISRPVSGSSVEKFNLQNLAGGVYFVRISGEGVKAIKKFVYLR